MPSAVSCCSFSSGEPDRADGHRYPYGSDSANVTEKHYGCYKAGIFFALAIILLLLVGCVPVFLLTANSNLMLLILLVTLAVIGLATFVYFRWQRNRALAMRRTYEQQKFSLTRVHQPTVAGTVPAAPVGPASHGTPADSTGDGLKNGSVPFAAYAQGPTQGRESTPIKGDPTTMSGAPGEESTQRTTTATQPRYSFI
ncbi:uncharacterized protein LOC131216573 [Anopheles bellator]|uniref:uncharacterized protein LOC131216573 n=1 Tax=Anopheles bellator TaxID=139047 RepID=UPI0026487638|nr:uncharacterized protein LOC131216573 [Anopheles bellator]